MKQVNKITLLFVLFVSVAMQGSSEYDYGYYAVYMSRETLEKSVFFLETGKEIKNPGKIYYKKPYLFINEKYKGVHVIDNTDPKNPVKKGFIVAPGCLDMAVKDSVIYLDNAVDMVSFDLTEMKEAKRIRSVFPELVPPGDARYDDDRGDLIIVEWVKK
ncbi:MAG: hypothetical protein LBQ01_06455 [Prevotellaceae bacterium]|jgi:hypothetical protein|nr:hypothetical protein [Prevotellaceae bacterium]